MKVGVHLKGGLKNKYIEMYNNGMSFRDISKFINVPTTTVWRYIKSDVSARNLFFYREKCRRYPIDENYFELINDSNKAYILGLLLADGHRCKNVNQIRLKLQERDKEILISIKNIMNYNRPLIYERRKNSQHQNTYLLIICNKKICMDLEKYGIVKNKTFNIFPPQIDDKYFMDLFRGYFDGDGWITIYNKKSLLPELGIIGEYNFIKFIKNKLEFSYNIKSYFKIDKRKSIKIISLRIRKMIDVQHLFKLMYKKDALRINRKYIKFDEILNHE